MSAYISTLFEIAINDCKTYDGILGKCDKFSLKIYNRILHWDSLKQLKE